MDMKQKAGTDVANNAIATTKKPGGITGRGFRPGQSGNPTGGTRRRREAKFLSEQIRDYLAQPDAKATEAAGRKVTRLQNLIMRLEQTDPRVLLEFAYGKPATKIEATGLADNTLIIVKHAHEVDAEINQQAMRHHRLARARQIKHEVDAEINQQATSCNRNGVDVRFANDFDDAA
jgi:hypothetical protein